MAKKIAAIVFVFICTTIAWMILGGVTVDRTNSQDNKLKRAVGQLWGTAQRQNAPLVYYQLKEEQKVVKTTEGGKTVTETKTHLSDYYLNLESSDIKADLKLTHRKKGLLWYSTYQVNFDGSYGIVNSTREERFLCFQYTFPSSDGIYDDFVLSVDGVPEKELVPVDGKIWKWIRLKPGQTAQVRVAYRSQGMDQWWYQFGSNVSQIRNFKLAMTTDFARIDFPENGISPTSQQQKDGGWELVWQYNNLISGIQIGMDLPKKINPGPFVSKISFFAPVSLFLFFFMVFIITAIRGIRLHPMHYFFLAASFFAFHLLMAYLADHADIYLAFFISAAVSLGLVLSYMRIVTGSKFAFKEAALAQLVYLVFFSYAFFWEGYTGLAITICCIATLFVVMQFTARIDWEKQFSGK
ncbi:MAG: inner membrane CreD family protein [bacterium]|nr:inner membrane CreD family protein [bacterium]